MTLDKIKIGERIRNIRELEYNRETRAMFAERCRINGKPCWAN